MKFFHLLFFWMLLAPVYSFAQYDFSGSWAGKLTQDAGGFTPEYEFELYLVQKGKQITGRSYVRTGRIYAVVELSGEVLDGQWIHITETRILDNWKYEDMDWCYKKAHLKLTAEGKRQRLQGPWTGITAAHSVCIPGEILLFKQAPRA